jgi:glycosyltransferase involved in cell wall biosynthesis
MLSIIVPTLNEEKYLPSLLESIFRQDFKDFEIIVSDAGSKDKTLEIAKKYNCKTVRGGLPGKGKNEGAKIAKGNFLLFLDADVIIPDGFLRKSTQEIEEKKMGVASCFMNPTNGDKIISLLMSIFYNFPALALESFLPHGAVAIFVRKEIFDKIGGFDENVTLAEDHDFTRKASKLVKYRMIRSSKISISTRRFDTDGWIKTYYRYLLCEFHMIFFGPVKSDKFHYKFNHYADQKK